MRSKVSGGLVLPEDAGYPQAKQVANVLFDDRRPAAVARCATVADVQACLAAAAGRVPVAARSGGHSYVGNSAPDGGLVMDLSAMSRVRMQGDQAVVGAGVRLADLYSAVAASGRALPGGSCPTVGVAGLTLGGGIGVLSRAYGLTCDRLVEAQVVTADGTVRTASASSEPDLFWALRGGGGGNFGVVTSFTFATFPAPSLSAFFIQFPAGAWGELIPAWQQWVADAPRQLWSMLRIDTGDPAVVFAVGSYVGDAAGVNRQLDSLVSEVGHPPVSRVVRSFGYLDAMRYYGGGSGREGFVASSRVLVEPLGDPRRLLDLVHAHPGLSLLIDAAGGAIGDVGPQDTAFWHRRALATVQIYGKASVSTRDAVTRQVAALGAGLAALGAAGGYINYLDPALPDWLTAYYGGNASRLADVARRYDRERVFTGPGLLNSSL
ncbi:FAD-dependent oxidoreductase [Catenulispora subtropica]|uniref:FAD-binding oxidoreductase n=1 Tax=Catenulispora subtropica TaxID=450798 RepID=A0ABP5EKF6_9ACTN